MITGIDKNYPTKNRQWISIVTQSNEQHVVGPLASDFWQIRVPPELITTMAREMDWDRLGKRVMIGVREGIIS